MEDPNWYAMHAKYMSNFTRKINIRRLKSELPKASVERQEKIKQCIAIMEELNKNAN